MPTVSKHRWTYLTNPRIGNGNRNTPQLEESVSAKERNTESSYRKYLYN